jgi:O-antigen/teichoic acid export membrane protein
MSGTQWFGVHRTWEDWAGMVLGLVIGFSPWFAGEEVGPSIMLNTAAIGILVFALAAFELVSLHRSEEAGEIALGLWLIASPFAFGYADATLAIWHYVIGALVAALGALELWQDWRLSDRDLARHGQ